MAVKIKFAPPAKLKNPQLVRNILLISGALGFMATFGVIAYVAHEPETWAAGAFGLIPLFIGFGYLLDFTLTRREAHS